MCSLESSRAAHKLTEQSYQLTSYKQTLLRAKGKHLNVMQKRKAKQAELSLSESNGGPGEKISRSVVGEVLPPVQLPPELQKLSRDWERLTYEQRVTDVKKRPEDDRIRLLQSIGGVC